jgi:hypothetical protein
MKKKILSRPYSFRLNKNHFLYKDILFAGLGNYPVSDIYNDSSIFCQNGNLFGFTTANDTPIDKWSFNPEINRWILNFDGANDYISAINKTFGLSKFTISIFMKCTSGYYCFAYDGRSTTNPYYGFVLYGYSSNGKLQVASGPSARYAVGTTSIYDGHYHHLVATYDATLTNPFRLFVDGTSETLSSNTIVPSDMTYQGTTFFSGKSTDPIYSNCYIADCMVFNRVLLLEEIKSLSNPFDPMLNNLILSPKRKYFPIINIKKYSIFQSAIFNTKKNSNIVRGVI